MGTKTRSLEALAGTEKMRQARLLTTALLVRETCWASGESPLRRGSLPAGNEASRRAGGLQEHTGNHRVFGRTV